MEVRFPKSKAIIPNVNYFGQKSKGAGQLRGNGTMLLTDDALVFEMWLLNRDLTIPFSAITGIENPRSFLGKSRFRPLLQVNFTNADGQPDSAAWHVPDVEGLQRLIETAVKERT
jgi:hypothetical protein